MEGVTWPYLLNALHGLRDRLPAGDARDWFDAALEAMHLADASEHLYRQLAAAGVVPRVPTPTEGRQALTHAVVSSGVNQVMAVTGLDAAARATPSLVADAQSAGDFGPQHFAYYKLGYTDDFSVGGRTGYGYALDWTSHVIDGVLAGR